MINIPSTPGLVPGLLVASAAALAVAATSSAGGSTPPPPVPIPGVSATIAFIGSSTPERYFSDYVGTVSNPQVTYSTDGRTFQPLGTYGAGATVLGDEVQRSISKPVRLLKLAERGSRMSEWIAQASAQRAAAVAAIIAAGDANAIVCCYVGGNDALATAIVSETQHIANYRTLIAQVRSETGFTNLRFLIWGINQVDPGLTAAQKAQVGIARRGELAVAEDADVRFGVSAFDLALSGDFLHMAEASYPVHARRVAGQLSAWLTGAPQRRGARITSAVRVTDTQTRVTLTHGVGGDFTPAQAITGFVVGAGAITAAVREDASHILLTHPSSNGQTFALTYADGGTPDLTGILFDNAAPALPVETTKAALTVTGVTTAEFLETFTAPDDTTIATGRVTDSGHVATVNSGSPKINSGMARGNGAAIVTYSGFQAKSLTTSVRATLLCRTAVGSIFLAGHVVDNANQIFAGYQASAGGWTVSERIGDASTVLGQSAFTPVEGATYVAELQFAGDAAAMTVRLLVNGAEVVAPKAIATASIRTALAVGARFATANSAVTGWAMDRLETL